MIRPPLFRCTSRNLGSATSVWNDFLSTAYENVLMVHGNTFS